jgi:hypothetical protein
MSRVQIDTLASAIREVRKKVKIVPFETDVSEESIGLSTQKYVDPDKWGVTPIESWSKTHNRPVPTKNIWDEVVHFQEECPYDITVDFKYFLDGIQRTTPIGKVLLRKSSYETVPIHFAQIGIVLLSRSGRVLSKEDERIKLLLEFPNSFVISETNIPELKEDLLEKVSSLTGKAILGVDTSFRIARLKESETAALTEFRDLDGIRYPRINSDELWRWCSDPAQFRNQARRWTTRYRDIVEQELYDKALERYGNGVDVGHSYCLVVKDGPLTHMRGGFTKSAIGVIKTFNVVFLHRPHMDKVLGLPYGYRSPVFTKTRPEGNPEEAEVYEAESGAAANRLISWYVRIRPVGNHDTTWGLLRLEMHCETLPCEGHVGRWSELDTCVIDEISRKLCAEASPSSHPDPRWNNLLYPIKCCESFLRSRVVPHVTARYLLGGS